jgi:hypothetical protein
MSQRFVSKERASDRTPMMKSFGTGFGEKMDGLQNLLAEGRTLLTPKEVLEILFLNNTDRIRNRDWNTLSSKSICVYTGCAMINNPSYSGEVLATNQFNRPAADLINSLGPESEILLESKGKFLYGKLAVTQEQYDAVKADGAFIITPQSANRLRCEDFSEADVLQNFWDYVIGNAELSADYRKPLMQLDCKPGLSLLGLYTGRTMNGCSSGGEGFSTPIAASLFGAELIGVHPEYDDKRDQLSLNLTA